MQELLDQPQRAQPSADGSPQDHAVQQDNAQDVPSCPMAGGGQGILNGTERAAAYGAGAGIAVEAGNADVFRVASVDFSINKAFDVSIMQECRIQLHQPPCRRPVFLPEAGFLFFIQGQHTPYKLLLLCKAHPWRFR